MNAPHPVVPFVPVPNGKGCRAKQRAAAEGFRARLLDLMATNGPMGAKHLAELGGARVSTVRDHLDWMLEKGLIESEKIRGRTEPGGGVVTCVYRVAGDDMPSVRRNLSVYPRNEVADPYALPAAFFGARHE